MAILDSPDAFEFLNRIFGDIEPLKDSVPIIYEFKNRLQPLLTAFNKHKNKAHKLYTSLSTSKDADEQTKLDAKLEKAFEEIEPLIDQIAAEIKLPFLPGILLRFQILSECLQCTPEELETFEKVGEGVVDHCIAKSPICIPASRRLADALVIASQFNIISHWNRDTPGDHALSACKKITSSEHPFELDPIGWVVVINTLLAFDAYAQAREAIAKIKTQPEYINAISIEIPLAFSLLNLIENSTPTDVVKIIQTTFSELEDYSDIDLSNMAHIKRNILRFSQNPLVSSILIALFSAIRSTDPVQRKEYHQIAQQLLIHQTRFMHGRPIKAGSTFRLSSTVMPYHPSLLSC